MKINIQVVTGSSQQKVKKLDDGSFKVWIFGKPIEGEANQQIIESLSKYFDKTKSQIKIIAGLKSKRKIIELGD